MVGLWVRGTKNKFGGGRVDLWVIGDWYLRVNGSKIIHVHDQKPYKKDMVVNAKVFLQKRLRSLPALKIVLRVNGVIGRMLVNQLKLWKPGVGVVGLRR